MHDGSEPVVVFAGTVMEAALAKSLLEGNGIRAFLWDEHIGACAPWYVSAGGLAPVKVVVAAEDREDAQRVLDEAALQDAEES